LVFYFRIIKEEQHFWFMAVRAEGGEVFEGEIKKGSRRLQPALVCFSKNANWSLRPPGFRPLPRFIPRSCCPKQH